MERESPKQPEEPQHHEETIRLFISSPDYALAERNRIADLLVRINAAFAGKIRVETIDQTGPGSEQPALTAADCDGVVALMRPRRASDVTPSGTTAPGDASQGGVSGVLSAVQGRKANTGLPDIYIFRYVDPNDTDADWEGRKQVFDSWFQARGGKVLAFDDFSALTEFIAKLEHRLRSWLARLGYEVSEEAGLAAGNENIQRGSIEAAPSSKADLSNSTPLDLDLADESKLIAGETTPVETATDDLRSEAADAGIEALDEKGLDDPQPGETPDTEGPATDSAELIAIGHGTDQEPSAAGDDLSGTDEPIVDEANPSEAETSENRDKETPADIEISATDAAFAIDAEDGEIQESSSESHHVSEADEDISGEPISDPDPTAETAVSATSKQAEAVAQIGLPAKSEPSTSGADTGREVELAFAEGAIPGDEPAVEAEVTAPDGDIPVSGTPDDDIGEAAPSETSSIPTHPEETLGAATENHSERARQIEDEKAAEKPGVTSAAEIEAEIRSEISSRLRGRKAWRKSSKAKTIEDIALETESTPPLETDVATEERPDAGIESSAAIAVRKSETSSEDPETIDAETIDAGLGKEISTSAIDASAETPSLVIDTKAIVASKPIPDALSLSQKPASVASTDDRLPAVAPVAITSSPDVVVPATAREGETDDGVSETSQEVRDAQTHAEGARRKPRRIAWATAAAAIVILAIVGIEWRNAAVRRDRAEQNLAAAADRAGTLVSELAKQKSQQPSGAGEAAKNDALDKARSLLGDLASAAKFDPVERKTLAESLMASSGNLLKEGKLDDALKAATQARDILQTLSTAEPDQPDWLNRLAQSDSTIGELYFLQKDIDDALGSFLEALAIRHALVVKDPGDPDRQKALASTQRRTGDMQLEKRRLDDALAVYRDAQAIYKTSAQNSPDAPDPQQSLIEIDDVIGDTLTARNNLDDALGVYREELTIAQHMAQTAPGEPKWQRAAALANNKVGDVLLAKQRIDDAIAAYREGLAIVKALAAKEPASKDWQSMSATSQERIGDALAAETHSESALSAYNEALATVTALAAKEPGNGEWQRGISETQLRIGWILFKQGKIDASIAAHRESLAVVKGMIAREPGNTRWHRDLMLDDGKIAQLLMAQGNHANALPIYQEALTIAKEMGPKDPGNTEWQNTRAVVDSNVGRLLMEIGKQDEALIAYRDARNTAEALALKDPANVDWQTGLVIAYYNLAEAGEDTNANLLRASEILKRLDAAGALPADKKMLIGKIDEELDNSTRQVKRR